MSRTLLARLGYVLARGAFDALREKLDPRKVNGGVFLGLNGIVVKSHGGTDAEGFAAAVDLAYDMVKQDLMRKITESLTHDHRAGRARGRLGRGLMATIRSVMRGVGSYLPANRVTNDDLAEQDRHDATNGSSSARASGPAISPPRARRRPTSRRRRHGARSSRPGSSRPTSTSSSSRPRRPDNTFPATATTVQANLGITGGAAFDVQAVCTGFVYGLTIADNFLRSGSAKHALVIGAETYSRIVDWNDRTTCVLFGDGAGAAVLEATMSDGSIHDRGVLAARLRSDGRHKSKLYVDGGPSTTGKVGHLRMDGKEVFKLAVGMVPQILHDTLDDVGLPFSAIDWFVPHQANRRIIDATAEKLGIPSSQGRPDRRRACQHLRRVDSARPRRRGPGRPHQGGRHRSARGDGRRLHLGRGPDPVVGRFRVDRRLAERIASILSVA